MGRKRKAVKALHAMAEEKWRPVAVAGNTEVRWADIEAQFFGVACFLRRIEEFDAATEAHFLAAMAGHHARGNYADVSQPGIFADAESRN